MEPLSKYLYIETVIKGCWFLSIHRLLKKSKSVGLFASTMMVSMMVSKLFKISYTRHIHCT